MAPDEAGLRATEDSSGFSDLPASETVVDVNPVDIVDEDIEAHRRRADLEPCSGEAAGAEVEDTLAKPTPCE